MSQEGKREMSEDDVFGISGTPLRRAAGGLRWGGEHLCPGLALLFLALYLQRPSRPFSFLSHSRGPPVTLTMPHFHFLWAGGRTESSAITSISEITKQMRLTLECAVCQKGMRDCLLAEIPPLVPQIRGSPGFPSWTVSSGQPWQADGWAF